MELGLNAKLRRIAKDLDPEEIAESKKRKDLLLKFSQLVYKLHPEFKRIIEDVTSRHKIETGEIGFFIVGGNAKLTKIKPDTDVDLIIAFKKNAKEIWNNTDGTEEIVNRIYELLIQHGLFTILPEKYTPKPSQEDIDSQFRIRVFNQENKAVLDFNCNFKLYSEIRTMMHEGHDVRYILGYINTQGHISKELLQNIKRSESLSIGYNKLDPMEYTVSNIETIVDIENLGNIQSLEEFKKRLDPRDWIELKQNRVRSFLMNLLSRLDTRQTKPVHDNDDYMTREI